MGGGGRGDKPSQPGDRPALEKAKPNQPATEEEEEEEEEEAKPSRGLEPNQARDSTATEEQQHTACTPDHQGGCHMRAPLAVHFPQIKNENIDIFGHESGTP